MFLRRSEKSSSYSPWVAVAVGAAATVLGSLLVLIRVSSGVEYTFGRELGLVFGGFAMIVIGLVLAIRGKRLWP